MSDRDSQRRLPFGQTPYPGNWPGFHRDALHTEILAALEAKRDLSLKQRVAFAFIENRGRYGATDDEGIEHCFFSFPKRRCELYHLGLVEPLATKGLKVTRPTRQGSQATVWVVKSRGPQEAA